MNALTRQDLDLLEEAILRQARKDFWAFRKYMNPKMKVGWWQWQVAGILQNFYVRLKNGERPIEVIEAPPQHGKSEQIIDFMAWVAGQDPDLKTIFASFSERLGVRANLRLQRMYDSEKYKKIFPDTTIAPPSMHGANSLRNRDILEYERHSGYFRNTTIRGPITGEGLDFGVIDDPIKGRLEANSESVRDTTWEWFTDDFFSRYSESAGTLIILTRWHVDDPVGRLKELYPDLVSHRFPAIAEKDEKYRKKGEALFPEHKSLDFLLKRKELLTPNSWEALYQQNPYIRSGNMLPTDKFHIVDFPPVPQDVVSSVRYWDKAGTKDGDGAYTAGVRMDLLKDGRVCIRDVRRGRWAALEREDEIKRNAVLDGYGVVVGVEQEPGSGGKESAEATIRNLKGFSAFADRPTGDKTQRADPFATQVQSGNVLLVRGPWNRAFLQECEEFPNGKYKDQVDACSGAFARLCGSLYDMEALAS